MSDNAREYITVARQLSSSGCYSKSFEYYMRAFEKSEEMKTEYEPEFRLILDRLNELLLSANKMEDIFINFSRVLEAFPDNIYFLNDIGKYLYKYEFYNEAWSHFEKAIMIDPTFVNGEKNLNSVKNFLVERWHYRMLNDRIRNESYRLAIHETLIPIKDSVLDIGTGTGLLAMYAGECKPLAITACDGSDVMTSVAECVTMENGFDQIVIINQLSTAMNYRDIGGKRSLVLTELFDAGLFGEHVLLSLDHAWEHLINNVGRVIPNKAEFFIVGVDCQFLHNRYQLCAHAKSLLNISAEHVHSITYDETYDCEDVHLYGDDLKYMTEPQSVVKVDFNNHSDIQDTRTRTTPINVNLNVIETGEINIYIGWFNLYLTDTISLTTNPTSPYRANAWQQAIFFDNIPDSVKKNEVMKTEFLMNGGKLTMSPNHGDSVLRISNEIIRFLNDTEYMNMICGCLGMACVYLGQMAQMSQINIVDLCPFPMFGLQLLKRGVQSLICYARHDKDKEFFEMIFQANDIPLSKITILEGEEWSQEYFGDEKYHAIFCNIFEMCGDIDLFFNELAQHLRHNNLIQGGLFMPASIKLMGQLVHSHWLDINNKLYDENVKGLKIAEQLNKYMASQNFGLDFSHLEMLPLTEPSVIGTCDSPIGTEIISLPLINDGHASAILCWYSIELMEDLDEISTNRKNSFIDGTAFMGDPTLRQRRRQTVNIVRCVDPDGAFKVMMMKPS